MGDLSFHGRTIQSHVFQAKDLLRLAALGCAARRPVTADDIWVAIEDIAGHLWVPACSVLSDAIIGMLEQNMLTQSGMTTDAEPLVQATSTGVRELSLLLSHIVRQPSCPLGQTVLQFQMAFMDLLPPHERRNAIDAAINSREMALAENDQRCAHCPARGHLGHLWQTHQADQLRQDLQCLRRLASSNAPPLHAAGRA